MPSYSPNGKIKVLRIIGRLNIGGPAIHVVNLTAGLDPTRFEQLLVIGTENPSEGSMLDHALSHGVQPHHIPEIVTDFSLKPRDLTALNKLYQLMRQERPQIVHTHTAKAGLLGRLAARMARVPVVVHTYHGHVLQGYYSPLKNTLVRRMEQSLALLSNRLIAVSEQVKRDLVYYGVAPETKIEVIPLGFDLSPFLEAHIHRGQLRQAYGLDNTVRLIGIVGRLFPIKNHRLFLDAAARVAAQEPQARFLVVGDGDLRSALEQQAQALGIADRVIFTGWRRDLPRIYADLDLLVVSSDNEGTPVSAIEAMASGCPVVATRVGGLPDFIDDGKTGIFVPPREPNKLATAIVELLDHPQLARNIGHTAQEMVQERFTVQRLIANIDCLYQQMLSQRGLIRDYSIPYSTPPVKERI